MNENLALENHQREICLTFHMAYAVSTSVFLVHFKYGCKTFWQQTANTYRKLGLSLRKCSKNCERNVSVNKYYSAC